MRISESHPVAGSAEQPDEEKPDRTAAEDHDFARRAEVHPIQPVDDTGQRLGERRHSGRQCGGQAIESKTGHAFIKERMREEDAVYGGEMSAHHYFKEFFYCDSGMIPWLLVLELVCKTGKPLKHRMPRLKHPSGIGFQMLHQARIKNTDQNVVAAILVPDFTNDVRF